MAKPVNEYKKEDKDMSAWFSYESSFPNINLKNFKYSDKSNIAGILKTDVWQREREDIAQFYNDGEVTSFKPVYAGDSPKFADWAKIDKSGTYTLKVQDNKLVLSSTKTTAAVDFRDGVVPNRMILVLQAAGGGGGASSNVFAAHWCIGGGNGGAGGSGACFAVVLNTEKLKENSSNYYTIKIGSGGAGGFGDSAGGYIELLTGSGAIYGGVGADGGSSSLSFNGTELIVASGGGGGGRASGYNTGGPGGGGSITKSDGSGTYW